MPSWLNTFILYALISVSALFGLYYWYASSTIESLKSENIAYELRDEQQKNTISLLEAARQEQTDNLRDMQITNQQIREQVERYLSIFERHDLSRLAAARPGLIETRVNTATEEVFNDIENDSSVLANLNSE